MPTLLSLHRHEGESGIKFVPGKSTASQVSVDGLVCCPDRVVGIGRRPAFRHLTMLLEPSEPALPFRQQLSPFPRTPGLFVIPLVESEIRMLTSVDLILTIQGLLDIDMVEQTPADQPEML